MSGYENHCEWLLRMIVVRLLWASVGVGSRRCWRVWTPITWIMPSDVWANFWSHGICQRDDQRTRQGQLRPVGGVYKRVVETSAVCVAESWVVRTVLCGQTGQDRPGSCRVAVTQRVELTSPRSGRVGPRACLSIQQLYIYVLMSRQDSQLYSVYSRINIASLHRLVSSLVYVVCSGEQGTIHLNIET